MSHTKGPWTWHPQDHSMAMLTGPDDMRDHVMSVGPCQSCADAAAGRGEGWKFGRCTTPTIEDARLIAAAPELLSCLKELHALVWGECPSLLNEDSDGIGRLDVAIRAALRAVEGR